MDNKDEYEDNGIHGLNTYQEAIEKINNCENETFRSVHLKRLSDASPNINMYFRKKINNIISEIDRL